jgi:Transposase
VSLDYHPSDQYIAFVDTETGECGERQLNHSDREAEKFYGELAARGVSVRVGMEATGYSRWFERLLAELGIEVWIGDAAEIKTRRVRKQKTDREDARLLLRLMRAAEKRVHFSRGTKKLFLHANSFSPGAQPGRQASRQADDLLRQCSQRNRQESSLRLAFC